MLLIVTGHHVQDQPITVDDTATRRGRDFACATAVPLRDGQLLPSNTGCVNQEADAEEPEPRPTEQEPSIQLQLPAQPLNG
jgi:hypothetical protein